MGQGAPGSAQVGAGTPHTPREWLCWYSQLHDQVEVGCALINILQSHDVFVLYPAKGNVGQKQVLARAEGGKASNHLVLITRESPLGLLSLPCVAQHHCAHPVPIGAPGPAVGPDPLFKAPSTAGTLLGLSHSLLQHCYLVLQAAVPVERRLLDAFQSKELASALLLHQENF